MVVELGSIFKGKVKQIKDFGAFVELPNGLKGLVHISEVARDFVVAVSDYLRIGQIVKVVVISAEEGRIGLSIKQALEEGEVMTKLAAVEVEKKVRPSILDVSNEKKDDKPLTFEEMITKYKQDSESKIKDLKKNIEEKQGT